MERSELQYIELYNEISASIKQKSCPVMNAVRDDAFRAFSTLRFPTRKQERYRYTDVSAAFAPNYGISLSPLDITESQYIFPISSAPIDLSGYYNKAADPSDAIAALNTALVPDGILVYVPKNDSPSSPIQIDNRLLGNLSTMLNRRLLIILESGAQATVIINDKGGEHTPDVSFLTTQVIEVFCKENSSLDLYEVEETDQSCSRFSNVYIQAERYSSVRHNSITLTNGLTRNLCDAHLIGEFANIVLNGCVIGSEEQHTDNNTLIHHVAPNCQSEQLYKYVLDGNSVGAFAGKILVDKGAQKTSSQETNANLCSSPSARMYSQPMLEIYADDVKCNHGSTVGVMDESALFYMRQRGIPEVEARMLLKNAFMGDVIDKIPLRSLRDRLFVKIEKRFRGEAEKCDTCRLCK